MAAAKQRQKPSTTRRRGGSARKKRRDSQLLRGDCIEVMAGLESASVDAVITDPPYGIGWQNEHWDSKAISEAAARSGRDRLTPNQAFELWTGMWAAECARVMKPGAYLLSFGATRTFHRLASGLENAGLEVRDTLMWLYGTGMPKSRHYPGGRTTALKPAWEPIVLARAPLAGTIVETIERFGTGALNTEACRTEGRHPANVIAGHEPDCTDESCARECAAALVDAEAERGRAASGPRIAPSRFLYCPKPSRAEREAGCEELPEKVLDLFPRAGKRPDGRTHNPHPTLKPLELMRWLVRLGCPPGGLVLDPFTGSGTTGAAAAIEGRRFCGIELEAPYIEIAKARIAHWGGAAKAAKPRSERRVPLGRRRR